MANTTNFNWETPDDTDLVKDGAAAMRTLGNSIDTSFVDLKGGTTGQLLAKASNTDLDYSWTTPTTPIQFSPNLAINGAFIVNQRGYTSTTNLASGAYGFDRWKSNYTNTALTFTAGVNSTEVTISTSGGLQQIVERENVPAGTYTLSWSGTATGRVYNSGSTPPSYAASPITFTADGTANVVLEFTASGSSKTLSLVKFERGSSATTYSLAGGTFQGELAACQRYYYRTSSNGSTTFTTVGNAYSTTNAVLQTRLPVTMRVTPTAVDFSTLQMYSLTNGGQTAITSVSLNAGNGDIMEVIGVVASGLTSGHIVNLRGNGSGAFLGFSAEL
jgi:hypothetical protein